MYVRNGANGPQEANEFERGNRSFVTQANEIPPQAASWSCNTLCGVEQSISNGCFFLPSATQNESTKHKHFLGDFPRDPLDGSENSGMGLWIPRCIPPDMGAPNVQSDRVPDEVTSNIIQLLDSMSTKTPPVHNEKKKNEVTRKCRRSKPSHKELMELYRISCPSGSKDRHSKVATARGPRDRRMRLSVETAIKFFHVQDRLGFDQPSKAVEWLIEKCRPAIDELPRISQSEILTDLSPPMSAHLQSDPAKFVMNCEENLVTNASSAQRKRNRSSKLTLHDPRRPLNLKELKTKAKDRSGEGTKCRSYGRKGQARCSPHVIENPAETLNFEDNTASNGYKLNQGLEGNLRRLLNMHGHEFTSTFGGMQKLPNSVENAYFKYAQCSPDMLVQSYPYQQQEGSSVQSAESFSGPDSTAFSVPSCPFPQVMPSITIDPQSTTLKF